MSKRPKRKLPRTDCDFEGRSLAIRKRLSEESDRGKIIVGAEMLNEDLELLIRSRMRILRLELDGDIFKGFGPLSSFSGKTKLAYALQMIDDDVFHDLNVIRDVRNHFAHSYSDDSPGDDWVVAQAKSLQHGVTDDKKLEELCFRLAVREERQPNDETWLVAPEATSKFLLAVLQISQTLLRLSRKSSHTLQPIATRCAAPGG